MNQQQQNHRLRTDSSLSYWGMNGTYMYLTGAKSSPWILLYLPSENKFLQTRQAGTWQNIHSCFVLASLQTCC